MTATASRPAIVRCLACATRNRVDLARLEQGPRCGGCRRPLHLDRPLSVTEADLEETIRTAGVPVLVDFYADWCGPCRATAPALEALAGAHGGELLVVKLDTDRHPGAAARYGVRGIPTLIVFRDGGEVRRHVGAAGTHELEALAGVA